MSHLSSDALQALDDAYIASLQPRKQIIKPTLAPTPSAPAVPTKTPEELAQEDRLRRLTEMIKKGRLEALRSFWEKHSTEFGVSALGIAASAGQEEIIRFFLEEAKLDPTQSIDGKKAYDMCLTKGARNVFRRLRNDYPDWYDWNNAHVPQGLSEEMEEKQDFKRAERRKGLKEKMKEREKVRFEEEEKNGKEEKRDEIEKQIKANTPALGGGNKQKLGGRDVGGMGGMSEEMRQKVERERRARAAEERFKKMGM